MLKKKEKKKFCIFSKKNDNLYQNHFSYVSLKHYSYDFLHEKNIDKMISYASNKENISNKDIFLQWVWLYLYKGKVSKYLNNNTLSRRVLSRVGSW